MAGVAGIYNIPSTQAELFTWSFVHAAHHEEINRAIANQTGTLLVGYVLDPFDPNAIDNWAAQHQVMHQNQNQILGISGFDLSEVDFKDPRLLSAWIFLNAQEHYQAANLLGIG